MCTGHSLQRGSVLEDRVEKGRAAVPMGQKAGRDLVVADVKQVHPSQVESLPSNKQLHQCGSEFTRIDVKGILPSLSQDREPRYIFLE